MLVLSISLTLLFFSPCILASKESSKQEEIICGPCAIEMTGIDSLNYYSIPYKTHILGNPSSRLLFSFDTISMYTYEYIYIEDYLQYYNDATKVFRPKVSSGYDVYLSILSFYNYWNVPMNDFAKKTALHFLYDDIQSGRKDLLPIVGWEYLVGNINNHISNLQCEHRFISTNRRTRFDRKDAITLHLHDGSIQLHAGMLRHLPRSCKILRQTKHQPASTGSGRNGTIRKKPLTILHNRRSHKRRLCLHTNA